MNEVMITMNTNLQKNRGARSLTFTLAIAFFSLSVVVLLLNGGLATYTNYRALQDTIAVRQLLVAQEASKTVAVSIEEKFTGLETAIEFANPVVVNSATRNNIMDSLLGIDPAFRQFALVDEWGRELAHVSRISQSLSSQFSRQLQGDSLTQTAQGLRYISPIYIDDVTSEPLIAIAIPVLSVLDDYEGTVVAEVNLKFMWELVDQLEIGETGYAYVVDQQGNLIAFEDTTRVLAGENASIISEVKEFVENPGESANLTPEVVPYTGLIGTTVVGTYVPLGTPNWAVVIEQPTTEAYAVIYRSIIVSTATILLMALVAGIAGVAIARRLAVPLIDLTGTATRIADGEIELQAAAGGAQEFATLAIAFNKMTSQLREVITSLEDRVAARTRDLAIVAEVGTATATILESKRLLQEVVDLTKERFNLYHSHIYLLDEDGKNLVLAAGVGEPGRVMVAEGRSIPMDREQSLVARAARERKGVTVNDVTQAPDFLPNPLLPDTRSELAVPMIVGGKVIGVFDIQSEQVGRFSESDVNIQTTLASQLAISIQNVHLFEQSKKQADFAAQVNLIGQKIQLTTTIEETLQTAIRELGTAVGASRVRANVGISRQPDRDEAGHN
jgi:putative methionine-R-sulfoxide reductase with GAF domain